MVKVKKDLTGQQFGRWTVVKQAEDYISPKGKHRVQWLCECSCKNKTTGVVESTLLKRGHSKSCGCLHKEIVSEIGKMSKKYNQYDLTGDYGIGYTSKGEEFYFDLEYYDLIKDYCWHNDKYGYIVTNDRNDNYKRIKMHRLIMGFPNKQYDIDHKHGKESRNDNRKSNLRVATRIQNSVNKGISTNNTSGVTGVHFNKKDNVWVARITVNRKRITLGSFKSFEDAVKARKEAEEKYFGEYSYDNSQKRQEC